MKATGNIRRIDDLGRIVIPKAVLHELDIMSGSPMEIYIGKDKEIILKLYSPMEDPIEEQAERFYFNADENKCITERELVDFLFDEYDRDFSKEMILSELHSTREISGWFECEVSDVIKKVFKMNKTK